MKNFFAFIFVLMVVLESTVVAKNELVPDPEQKKFPGIVTYEVKKQEIANSLDIPLLTKEIKDMLEASKGKVKGIWFKIDVNFAHWVIACHKNGFELQLAVGKSTLIEPSEVIYMKKWLDTETPSFFPLPAFTTIGLSAVVMNEDDEYLLLKENPVEDRSRARTLTGGYKLPGKALLPGENFEEAIKRILVEEVQMNGEHLVFHGILEIKHLPEGAQNLRGKGDMLVFCMLTTKKNEHDNIHKKHEWKARQNINEEVLKTPSNYKALLASDVWKQKYQKELQQSNGEPKLFDDKKKPTMTYLFYPQEEKVSRRSCSRKFFSH